MFSCTTRASVCDGTCSHCPKRKKRFLRYVFLDIDGVLNSRQGLKNKPPPNYVDRLNPTNLELGIGQLCREHVQRLNGLVEDDVRFVLSSTWRRWYKVPEMQQMLDHHGFKGTIVDRTPHLDDKPRGLEIAAWLESELAIELRRGQLAWPAFVILDDDGDMHHLRGRLVQTDYDTGLQDEHVQRARKMLGLSDVPRIECNP
jgi:hypothetical protein